MNRAVWTIGDPPPPDLLPPEKRAGPVRILFIHGSELGFVVGGRILERAAGEHPGLDAVHVRAPIRGLFRILAGQLPFPTGGLDQQHYRAIRAWGIRITRLLRGPLPLDRFDVVHIETQQRGWAMLDLAGRTPTKFALSTDATTIAYHRAFGPPRHSWDASVPAEARVLRSADLLACYSRWCADSAVLDAGVDPARVVLHKRCSFRDASLPVRRHDDAPPRGTPGAPPVRLVFVGNDWERKGGPRLLAWHQRHWADRAELHVCSGKAPQDHSLRSVVWHGPTPHATLMREVLPTMDLFVMPTRNDTFLLAAQEAQSVGLPVVTSRLAGIPEVVRHGRTGFLCDHQSDEEFVRAIGSLIDDGSLRRRMGLAALEHSRLNMSGDVWHRHLMDQLVNLADGRPIRYAPEGVDIRITDDEPGNPATEAESAALARSRWPVSRSAAPA